MGFTNKGSFNFRNDSYFIQEDVATGDVTLTKKTSLENGEFVYREPSSRSTSATYASIYFAAILAGFSPVMNRRSRLLSFALRVGAFPAAALVINSLPRGSLEFQKKWCFERVNNYSDVVWFGVGYQTVSILFNTAERLIDNRIGSSQLASMLALPLIAKIAFFPVALSACVGMHWLTYPWVRKAEVIAKLELYGTTQHPRVEEE